MIGGIPLIRKPRIESEDNESLFRGINRDHLLPRERALALIEFALIAPTQAPLLPAIRTQCRWRKEFFLPAEDRGDLLAEGEVIFRDLIRSRTLATICRHEKRW